MAHRRGVRVKAGVDSGNVVGEVNALSGRIMYRGKPVMRAARVSAMAASNQVGCLDWIRISASPALDTVSPCGRGTDITACVYQP